MKNFNLLFLIIFSVTLGVGLYFYPELPMMMATHWNTVGEPDGYTYKLWGVLLIPIISLFMLMLFLIIPKIDPLKDNIEKFRRFFDGMILAILLFLAFVHTLMIFWNIGFMFDMNTIMPPVLGIFIFYMGVVMQKAKRNWFVGIRTPWTLSSDRVWDKTHKLGGLLFKISGIIAVLSLFFPQYSFWMVIAPLIGSSIFLVVYSYFLFKKEANN